VTVISSTVTQSVVLRQLLWVNC